MSRNSGVDLARVLERLEQQNLGHLVVPFVQRALASLGEEYGESASLGLDDLLLRMVSLGAREAAFRLLVEVNAFSAALDAAEGSMSQRWAVSGRTPGALGYGEARQRAIRTQIADPGARPYGEGHGGLDERVVEYPWVFDRVARIHPAGGRVLDAGSTMNHGFVLDRWRASRFGPLSIVTLHHEGQDSVSDDVRYEFADLRDLPYRDGWFSTVLCLSTLEHVGMDNAIYGDDAAGSAAPPREAERALQELHRVLAPGGTLLLSVPFGAPAEFGWQRIFGREEIERIVGGPAWSDGSYRVMRAFADGWREVPPADAADAGYNEPHEGGMRSAPDHVAAAEAVVLVELRKGAVS